MLVTHYENQTKKEETKTVKCGFPGENHGCEEIPPKEGCDCANCLNVAVVCKWCDKPNRHAGILAAKGIDYEQICKVCRWHAMQAANIK